ncbi:Macrolide export ATP-binding/permease protein MacB [Rubripirellula lacrimiformis]|uniref:Macrolide export ATP-binding/permease protein MacB n=1 Tax=Rubripirellula lacrimiformis TaxID=1930273 RepID=A0A517NGJ6_9BACT|nr:ABC transporter ATP-binding protein [Rubripirellula lacrimiformis]QDT06254.1 Macrolide export ATP-binding/permease protein MacB [Rubripirellula lacrimiformis]
MPIEHSSFTPVPTSGASVVPVIAGKATDSSHPPLDSCVINAQGVRKVYEIGGQRQIILNDVDFHADAGEIVFLVGPSGSGKTTLLSILGCLLRCDAGQIRLADHQIDELNTAAATRVRRQCIGFVFQRFQLINALTARDNIALPLTLLGTGIGEARQQAEELLRRVGLLTHGDALPRSMSPGQCQRVSMARALITRPKVILADEPTAALDERSGHDAMTLMRELVTEVGSTTVVVTHDPRIYGFADRVCEIVGGKIS